MLIKLDNEIKMLGNRFGSISFDSLKISLAKIRKLRVLIETDLSVQKKYRQNECFSLKMIQNFS